MSYFNNAFYCDYGNGSSTGWWAMTPWATGATIAAGTLRRQTAPSATSERAFVAIIGGTTHATTEPTWGISQGAITTDNTVTWQECTGCSAVNGDATNTPNWTAVKNQAVSLGQIIKRNNGVSYQICTVAGTTGNGSEPAFSDTAGTATTDNTVTWRSLGAVGNFSAWGAPDPRLENAFTHSNAGGKIFVASSHQQTQASTNTIGKIGTFNAPMNVVCVNKAGSIPPVAADETTGATVAATGGSYLIFDGGAAFKGIAFTGGSGAGSNGIQLGANNDCFLKFKDCSLTLGQSGTNASFNMPNGSVNGVAIELDNTTLGFGAVGQTVSAYGANFKWKNTASAIQGSVPTKLFTLQSLRSATIECDGVDLSAMGSGKTIFDNTDSIYSRGTFRRCKLGASVTKAARPASPGSSEASFWQCDTAGTNYKNSVVKYQGDCDDEETIVRTGGASDGTQAMSRKLTTTANSLWHSPLVDDPIFIWNDTSGSAVTATVYGIWGGGAVPNNDDIWIEAEYLGSASSPQASFVNDTIASPLATNAGHTTDSSTWGGSTTKFKMAVTFTPQQKGLVAIRVKAAKPSTTFYIDPKVVLS